MKIATYLNTTENDLQSRKFNIFIGVSLGNKYFSKENIKDYLLWALENTKEKVAVLIPDKIHSVNYEVRSKYSKERAENLAFREGEKIKDVVENILSEIEPEKRSFVNILKWQSIETGEHKSMVKILHEEFENNKEFRNLILEIVKENIQSEKLTDSDYEKLATYPIEELPMLVSGIEYDGLVYDLLPYPGISKIDHLAIDLQEGKNFPEITKKLGVGEKLRLIEAYAK